MTVHAELAEQLDRTKRGLALTLTQPSLRLSVIPLTHILTTHTYIHRYHHEIYLCTPLLGAVGHHCLCR